MKNELISEISGFGSQCYSQKDSRTQILSFARIKPQLELNEKLFDENYLFPIRPTPYKLFYSPFSLFVAYSVFSRFWFTLFLSPDRWQP